MAVSNRRQPRGSVKKNTLPGNGKLRVDGGVGSVGNSRGMQNKAIGFKMQRPSWIQPVNSVDTSSSCDCGLNLKDPVDWKSRQVGRWLMILFVMSFFFIVAIDLLVLYLSWYGNSVALAVLFFYLTWWYFDWERPCTPPTWTGGVFYHFFRNWHWWASRTFFATICMSNTTPMERFEYATASSFENLKSHATRPELLACHPHGLLPFGMLSVFPFYPILPSNNRPIVLVTLQAQFMLPIWREILLLMGFRSAKRHSIIALFDAGFNVALSVGGTREVMGTRAGVMEARLMDAFGFLRVALQAKVGIRPVLTFGEGDLFRLWRSEWLEFFTSFTVRYTKILFPVIFWARGSLISYIPRSGMRLRMVSGDLVMSYSESDLSIDNQNVSSSSDGVAQITDGSAAALLDLQKRVLQAVVNLHQHHTHGQYLLLIT